MIVPQKKNLIAFQYFYNSIVLNAWKIGSCTIWYKTEFISFHARYFGEFEVHKSINTTRIFMKLVMHLLLFIKVNFKVDTKEYKIGIAL